MLTYNELIELKNKLIKNEIGIEEAKNECWKDFKKGQRSWHTKDWKERRVKIIKEKCEICSSKDTLTLQHLSHPKKFSEYSRELTTEFTKNYIDNNYQINKAEFTEHVLKNHDYVPVPTCPNCKNKRPSKRVTKIPKFRCTTCKLEFEEPMYKSANELITIFFEDEYRYEVQDKCFITKDKWRNKQKLANIKYWFQREQLKKMESETIEKKAFLLYLDDNIKYLSFEDTITACKKCASNFDLNNMELCPKCKSHYKGIQYPTCIQCLPEEKRKEVQEYIDFCKKEWEKNKELGID